MADDNAVVGFTVASSNAGALPDTHLGYPEADHPVDASLLGPKAHQNQAVPPLIPESCCCHHPYP